MFGILRKRDRFSNKQMNEDQEVIDNEIVAVLAGVRGLVNFADSDERGLAGDNMVEFSEIWEPRIARLLRILENDIIHIESQETLEG